MATATAVRYTVEEFEELELDHGRYELWWGELREMPAAGWEHGAIGSGLVTDLTIHVRPSGLGGVSGADVGFVLAREPKLVLVPDVAFVAAARLPALDRRRGLFDGAPDLAVEIVSPNDRPVRVEEKIQQWLRFGTRLVWVIWPNRRTVTVHTPDGRTRSLGEGDELDGGDLVPGFTIAVADLFR